MKAVVMTVHGGPDVLKIEDVTIDAPGPGEALVEVAFAGVNFMDTGTRRGTAGVKDLPFTPGVEGAGTVLAVGAGVTQVLPGDRVAWYFAWKSYAQQLIAPVDQLVPLPDDIDFAAAASVMMQGLTASHFVFESHEVKPGDIALVHAAAGGVGLLLTQMIRRLGGSVIARVSSKEKAAAAQAAGAEEVIVDREGAFADDVLRLTKGRGVDVVYDGTGAESFEDSMRSLTYHGTLALFGPLFDPPLPPVDVWRIPKSIKVTYPVVMHHARDRETLVRRSQHIFRLMRSGDLRVHIGGRYPLSRADQAHADIESRKTIGKLLLVP